MKFLRIHKQDQRGKDEVCKVIQQLAPGRRWEVQIKEWRDLRTTQQNARYFAMVSDIADQCNLTTDEMHDVLKHCNLGYVDVECFGETFTILQRSRRLEKDPFKRFHARCEVWGTERGVNFSWADGYHGETD